MDIYYICVCTKKKSEQHLRGILTSCILGRGLILQCICHSAGCTAQWLLLHATILQFLYSFSTVSFKAHGQDHTHQVITVRSSRTRGVTSSTISSWLCARQHTEHVSTVVIPMSLFLFRRNFLRY